MTKERRPKRTKGNTTNFEVTSAVSGSGPLSGYITTGEYEDGRLCEVFLKIAKQGGTVSGFADSLAITISHALQNGTPVFEICKGLIGMRFEPGGDTNDEEIPTCLSVADYIGRRLALDYCTADERERHSLGPVVAHSRFGMDT